MIWMPPGTTPTDDALAEILRAAGVPIFDAPVITVKFRTLPDMSDEEVEQQVLERIDCCVTDDGTVRLDAAPGFAIALGPVDRAEIARVEAHVAGVLASWAACFRGRGIALSRSELVEHMTGVIVAEVLAVRRASVLGHST